jgi:hypothetical protein
MNATMTAPSRQSHPPQQVEPQRPVRRVGTLDRLALRVGLALIMWNRRPAKARAERYITEAELRELDRLEQARRSVRPTIGPFV